MFSNKNELFLHEYPIMNKEYPIPIGEAHFTWMFLVEYWALFWVAGFARVMMSNSERDGK